MNKRIFIVSFRLPYRFSFSGGKLKLTQSPGGLATALNSYLESKQSATRFESIHWIGMADCSKKVYEHLKEAAPLVATQITLHPIFMAAKPLDDYYNGFCNSVLWPIFLYFPSFAVYKEEFYKAYQNANAILCDAVAALIEPGDTVWVHDYQLLLLPQLLRQKFEKIKIGFFLHIPFPTFEIFRIIPKHWRRDLLKGVLGADLIGFQTEEYATYFLESVKKILPVKVRRNSITELTHHAKVKAFPIGIDFQKFKNAALTKKVIAERNKIKKQFGSKKLMLSVDRLDYTKAIISRLESFKRFLERYPDQHSKLVYILLLVPSRDGVLKFRENKQNVELLISQINGQFGNFGWTPVIYQYRALEFSKLVSLYSAVDIAFIVPLRDGMNLVAKEFVATRTAHDGVLILSETAGAAEELSHAILVNPNDREEIASAILQAVNLSVSDQRTAIVAMQKLIKRNNVNNWVNTFLEEI
jgi:trehalose 6-phosphate synthase/phosphatase